MRWVLVFFVTISVLGGSGWAQRSSDAARPVDAVAAPPAGEGASELRAALGALVDVAAGDQATVSFVDHAAVRAGGAHAYEWFGLQLELGVVDVGRGIDAEAVEAATGLSLDEVESTLAIDAEVPRYLTLVRGHFDDDSLDAALSARGYVDVVDDRARRWCGPNGCDGGFETDMASRDDAFALFGGARGRSFPVARVGDMLAVSPSDETLDATLATAAGLAPSLLERPELAALVDALDIDAVVRQVWMPIGAYAVSVVPAGALSVLFADARRGDDEWLVVAAAFEGDAGAAAFAAGALDALGLTSATEPDAGTFEARMRSNAAGAAVDTVAHHGLEVVRIMVTRPFSDGVGSAQGRPAELLHVMMWGVMRFALPWPQR